MSRIDIDGEWERCEWCEGTGKRDGPGGWEECCEWPEDLRVREMPCSAMGGA